MRYVDQTHEEPLPIKLDHEQQLFSCTGGRLWSYQWPVKNRLIAFLFYRAENDLAKKRKLKRWQNLMIDLCFDGNEWRNRITGNTVMILHAAGSGGFFKEIWEDFRASRKSLQFTLTKLKKIGFTAFQALIQALIKSLSLYFRFRKKTNWLESYYYQK
jgi:hypothetical protein